MEEHGIESSRRNGAIEIEKLERSPLNARRTERKNGLAELKASILAHGLMQNLVVTANGGGSITSSRAAAASKRFSRSERREISPTTMPSRARSSPTSKRRR